MRFTWHRRSVGKLLSAGILLFLFIVPAQGWGQLIEEAKVEKALFGKLPDGTPVYSFTLINSRGASAKVITYGAILTELWVPGRAGKLADVVLGFDNLDGYIVNRPWFGATVGRVANRIAQGKFNLDGKQYSLEINNPPNNLHGGSHDLSHVVWNAEPIKETGGAAVRFSYLSPNGDGGFPGNLDVSVTYTLTDQDELKLAYTAKTDQATPVNMTHHSYFNLDGQDDILGEILYIDADQYTPVNADLIPTGEVAPVKGTPLDFTRPKAIGADIAGMKGNPGGYDHNFVLNGEPGKLKLAARVQDPASGRQMEAWTTEPGIQFYTSNFLDGSLTGKRGVAYRKHAALCLETQHYPDSVNHPNFPSVILRPGATYRTETIYKFSVR
jgi:aldose 1-epimerase